MNKCDMRVQRTYKLLSQALYELLDKKSFEDIKVVDICEKAKIHRTTFYKHFEDKYQLLSFFIENIIKELKGDLSKIDNYGSPEEFYQLLCVHIIDFLYENHKSFRMLIKNNRYNSFTQMFHNALCAYILQNLEILGKNGFEFIMPIRIIAEYRAGGLLAAALYLLNNDVNITREELFQNLMSFVDINVYLKK